MIRAVVFDLDGTLISTEEVWDAVRRELVIERGGRWADDAHEVMMGMSTPEWTGYMHRDLRLAMEPDAIADEVARRLARSYRRRLPLLPGAREAVLDAARRWPLGVASSSPREIIALAVGLAGLDGAFEVLLSSEEVARGKPAPDVYLEVLARMGVAPADAAAVEDSSSGIRSARAAGMRVVAIPNRLYPPSPEALALADAVVPDAASLTPDVLAGAG